MKDFRPGREVHHGVVIRLLATTSGLLCVLVVAYLPDVADRVPPLCMVRHCLGLHCAGCGMTRALACLARLDPVAAVRFNPLVVAVAPALALVTLDTLLKSVGRRGILAAVPAPLARGFVIALVAAGMLVFAVRIVSWAIPGSNPHGWLLPPAAFPG